MPHFRSRIERINSPIGQSIERHRRASGENHANEDSDQIERPKRRRRPIVPIGRPCHCRRQQRERQCKHGMAETDQFEQSAEHGHSLPAK
jgi:hypothetical protein